jgi:hypothetical protein
VHEFPERLVRLAEADILSRDKNNNAREEPP